MFQKVKLNELICVLLASTSVLSLLIMALFRGLTCFLIKVIKI